MANPEDWSRSRKLMLRYGGRLRLFLNKILRRYSLVGDPAIFERGVFVWENLVEENWQAIRDEALMVMRHREAVPPLEDVSPDHARLAKDGKWQSFFIWGYGLKAEGLAATCPNTTRIVEQIPGLMTAMFSIHAPGLHIPHHKGVTKAMINGHLALQVPKEVGKCRMMVDGELYYWEEGKLLIFDDTYYHEVWNDSDEDRIILLIQFMRPMRLPGRILAKFFLGLIRISPFVSDAKKNMAGWQDKFLNAFSNGARQ